MTYAAHVVKIEKIIPIANADNIVIGVVLGNQVIVSKAVSCEGDIGVYFPVDGQLSQEFCDANDLIVRKDENGKKNKLWIFFRQTASYSTEIFGC